MSAKWEHVVQTSGIDPSEIEEECNSAAANGAELIAAVVVEATQGEWRMRLIFKHPAE